MTQRFHSMPAWARRAKVRWARWLVALSIFASGCAAVTNPVVDGVPVRALPDEMKGKTREGLKPIPLTMLRQRPIAVHKVGAGDVLGIVIENVLGERNQIPPVRLDATATGLPPAIGYPILVQDNGTIALPYVAPINVDGLTLNEVQDKLRKVYTDQQILRPGTERIIVTLLQARRYHILVMRQDGGTPGVPVGPTTGYASPTVGASVKGTGYPLDLPIGENDVLNALAKTGGLPGTDAKNEVVIYKKGQSKEQGGRAALVIRIPLRMRPGDTPPFKPEDVILDNGDIVYIESRETEVFYSAGLLGAGQYPLPRDYDLDVIEAITYIRGPLLNGGFGQAQFVANAVNAGLGTDSPSLVTVLRTTASGAQLPIRIDLNQAMKDPRERLVIQPGDIVVLQERPGEAVLRYISQVMKFSIQGLLIQGNDFTLDVNSVLP